MKLRAFSSIAFVSLATCGAFAACSSFSTTPSEPDASVTPDASPSGADATSDGAPTEPRDAGSADAEPDAAFDCRVVIADEFTAKAASGNWLPSRSADAGEPDFSNQSASMSLPAGEGLFTVLASPPFFERTKPADPDLVLIDFAVTIPMVESRGVYIAQIPALTEGDNARIAAMPASVGTNGTSLFLIAPDGNPKGSIDLEAGKVAKLRWSYTRMGDEVMVTLERLDASVTTSISLTATRKPDASAAYFQMGPFSNRGSTLGAHIVYDDVKVRACTKRP